MTEEYHIEVDKVVHHGLVMNTIQSFGSEDVDITLLCDDGTSIVTNKRFLSFFSPLIKDICNKKVGNEEEMISVPGSPLQVQLLMDYLIKGEVKASEEKDINNVMSLLSTLGIESNSTELIKPFKSFKKILKSENADIDKTKDEIKSKKSKKKLQPKEKIKQEMMIEDSNDELDDRNDLELNETSINETNSVDENHEFKDKGFNCKYCAKEFGDASNLKQHLVKHTKEKSFECNECGKKFGTQGILYNHKGVHNPIVCEICERTFSQRASYKHHKTTRHPDQV